MKIDILSIFPKMFAGPFAESIIKRAIDKGIVTLNIHDLRKWTTDKHHTVDDRPYGGGPGMVMRVDVIDRALSELTANEPKDNYTVAVLSAKGIRYNQQKASALSRRPHLLLLCGHYEGIDHRVYEMADEIISIGDFVLTGGELPAMMVADSIVRLLPGALGKDISTEVESHSTPGYVEYPHYTRPEEYKGKRVPQVLLSGDHQAIEKWRRENSR